MPNSSVMVTLRDMPRSQRLFLSVRLNTYPYDLPWKKPNDSVPFLLMHTYAGTTEKWVVPSFLVSEIEVGQMWRDPSSSVVVLFESWDRDVGAKVRVCRRRSDVEMDCGDVLDDDCDFVSDVDDSDCHTRRPLQGKSVDFVRHGLPRLPPYPPFPSPPLQPSALLALSPISISKPQPHSPRSRLSPPPKPPQPSPPRLQQPKASSPSFPPLLVPLITGLPSQQPPHPNPSRPSLPKDLPSPQPAISRSFQVPSAPSPRLRPSPHSRRPPLSPRRPPLSPPRPRRPLPSPRPITTSMRPSEHPSPRSSA